MKPSAGTAAQQSSFFGINFQDTLTADHYLDEGDEVRWGNSALKVIHVPGHSRGHLVLWSPEDQFLLTGDVLFRGSIGRTDLEGGNYTSLITHIHRKLMVFRMKRLFTAATDPPQRSERKNPEIHSSKCPPENKSHILLVLQLVYLLHNVLSQ